MNREQSEAIKNEIAVWQTVLDGAPDGMGRTSPCCKKFRIGDSCTDCPIKVKTGKQFCSNTPYASWKKYLDNKDVFPYRIVDDRSRQIAENHMLKLRRVAE